METQTDSFSPFSEEICKVSETYGCLINGEYAVNGDGELNLSSKSFDVVPKPNFRLNCIVTLNLNFNNLFELPEFLCDSDICTSLQNLFLKGNRLMNFPTNIGNLTNLKVLDACENRIQYLSTNFALLKRLEKLKLVGNRLFTLPYNFKQLESLTELHLDQNYIKTLPSDFEELPKLESLELSYNRIKSLPLELGNLQQLRYLNLSYNKVRNLPDSVSCLQQLIVIDASHNRLTVLPKHFNSAPILTKIYLQNNRLSDLPSWFAELCSLEELNLEDNSLTRDPFPQEFGKISSQLRLFELGGNYLDNLPSSFGLMEKLEHVHLGSTMPEPERRNFQNGNCLYFLPENFGRLRALVFLRLDENQLKEIPESFGQLSSLEYLDLSHNKLRKLPDSFCQLKSLKTCLLCKNLLNALPDEFGNLTNVEDLRLDSNMLIEIPESFNLLKKVTFLDFSNNCLTQVPACISFFQSLKYLSMEENNFQMPLEQVPYINHKKIYPVGGRRCWRSRSPICNSVENEIVKNDNIDSYQNHQLTKVENEDNSEDSSEQEDECWDDDDYYDSLRETSGKAEITTTSQKEENWDVEINCRSQLSAIYDDDDIIQNGPVNCDIASEFCPGDSHVKPVLLMVRPKLGFIRGQFSDAEDD